MRNQDTPTVSFAEVARRLWDKHLVVEYHALSELARQELNPETSSCSPPRYFPDGSRVIGRAPAGSGIGTDPVFERRGYREDHYAVRTWDRNEETIDAKCVNKNGIPTLPDSEVYGDLNSDGTLPNGITLVGRIMKALHFPRNKNNLGETTFLLQPLAASAVSFNPPVEAQELLKIFVSRQHLKLLAKTHPMAAAYIREMQEAALDPLAGSVEIMKTLARGDNVTEAQAQQFLEGAAASIKERPWVIPLERAKEENWSTEKWNKEVARIEAVIQEHQDVMATARNTAAEKAVQTGGDAKEAGDKAAAAIGKRGEFAIWTIFNGLRVNHEAFLTGNLDDTLTSHIIHGRNVTSYVGIPGTADKMEKDTSMQLAGLMQGAVAAIPRVFSFEGPEGKEWKFQGQGPFVEYIERTLRQDHNGKWYRVNDAFLPENALDVFDATMKDTRQGKSWVTAQKNKLEASPDAFFEELLEQGMMKSAQAMLDTGKITLRGRDAEIQRLRQKCSPPNTQGLDRGDVLELIDRHLGMPSRDFDGKKAGIAMPPSTIEKAV